MLMDQNACACSQHDKDDKLSFISNESVYVVVLTNNIQPKTKLTLLLMKDEGDRKLNHCKQPKHIIKANQSNELPFLSFNPKVYFTKKASLHTAV